MTRPGGYALTITMAALLTVPLGWLSAQDEGGTIVEFRYTERLLWDDDELSSRSDLGFGLSSRTRNQYFLLDMFGGVDKFTSDGLGDEIEDPRVSLDYGLESRNSALTAALDYRRTDVDSLVFDDDLEVPDLVLDEGTREDVSARLGFELGREAPFGAILSLGYFSSTYSDTTSPLLLDSERAEGSLRLRFDITPRISANTTYDLSDLNREGGVDVRRETLSVGAALLVSPVLEAEVDVGTTRVVQSGSVPRSVSDGLFLTLAATRTLKNGALTGSLTSDLDENGRRTTVEVGRALDLPAGSLGFGVGLSQGENSSDLQPLYSLSYAQDLPRGTFGVDLSQSFGTDSLGNEILDSQLRLQLQKDLTPRDRLSAALQLRSSDGTGTSDTRFASIGLDYSHDLTADWSFVSGYTHTRRTEGGGTEDVDDTFFIGLNTTRQWRP